MSIGLGKGATLDYSLLEFQLGNVEMELMRSSRLAELLSDSYREFLQSEAVFSRTARDIFPLMSLTFRLTEKIMDEGDDKMKAAWKNFISERSALPIVSFRHKAVPAALDFELCLSACEDSTTRQHVVSVLDSHDEAQVQVLAEAIQRIDKKALGVVYSRDVLETLLAAERTACVFARTLSGEVVGYLYGVQVDVSVSGSEKTPCFYIVSAAREPEYGGRHLLQQLLKKGKELGQQEDSPFHADFIAWTQATGSVADNGVTKSFFREIGGVKIEPAGMTGVGQEPCLRQVVRLTHDAELPYPQGDQVWKEVCTYYRQEVGLVKSTLEYLKQRVQDCYYSWRYRNVAVEE